MAFATWQTNWCKLNKICWFYTNITPIARKDMRKSAILCEVMRFSQKTNIESKIAKKREKIVTQRSLKGMTKILFICHGNICRILKKPLYITIAV
jgi:hypothetical protein